MVSLVKQVTCDLVLKKANRGAFDEKQAVALKTLRTDNMDVCFFPATHKITAVQINSYIVL